jgi:hypothetical protein
MKATIALLTVLLLVAPLMSLKIDHHNKSSKLSHHAYDAVDIQYALWDNPKQTALVLYCSDSDTDCLLDAEYYKNYLG